MITVHTIAELRTEIQRHRAQSRRIGFVPTMGNLHAGHISLVDEASQRADLVVASIFVNPLQFGAHEDLDNYPRTLAADQEKLEAAGCDLLFAPSVTEMYPKGNDLQTLVEVPSLSGLHCGISRPTHFRGVATVVTKLFGIVQPDVAVFGNKDFQQLTVIRIMTEDLSLPVEIVGVDTARNAQGLALSSRNGYLSAEELEIAPTLYATLNRVRESIQQGRRDYSRLEEEANSTLEAAGFTRDYFHICRRSDLQPARENDQHLVILAAGKLGSARLIDNITFDLT